MKILVSTLALLMFAPTSATAQLSPKMCRQVQRDLAKAVTVLKRAQADAFQALDAFKAARASHDRVGLSDALKDFTEASEQVGDQLMAQRVIIAAGGTTCFGPKVRKREEELSRDQEEHLNHHMNLVVNMNRDISKESP
jgi:hypothetical protein